MVLLLLVGSQSVPPLPQDLADRPIVLVGVALVHQSTVALAEDHERVHGTANVVFLPLGEVRKEGSSRILKSAADVRDVFQFVYSLSILLSFLY